MQRKRMALVLVAVIIVLSVSQLSAAGPVTLEGLASALAALTKDYQDLRKNVEAIEAALEDVTPGLGERVEAIEAALENVTPGLGERVKDIEAALENVTPGLGERVKDIEAALENVTPGLGERVEAIEAALDIEAANRPAPAAALVNVRSGPGTNYSIIGVVEKGQLITATGRNQDGDWVRFSHQGHIGWVYAPLITVENPDELPVIAAPPPP